MIPNLRHSGRSSAGHKDMGESPWWPFCMNSCFADTGTQWSQVLFPLQPLLILSAGTESKNRTMGGLCPWTFRWKAPQAAFKSNSSKKEVSAVRHTEVSLHNIIKTVNYKMKDLLKLVFWDRKLQKSVCVGTSLTGLCLHVRCHHQTHLFKKR